MEQGKDRETFLQKLPGSLMGIFNIETRLEGRFFFLGNETPETRTRVGGSREMGITDSKTTKKRPLEVKARGAGWRWGGTQNQGCGMRRGSSSHPTLSTAAPFSRRCACSQAPLSRERKQPGRRRSLAHESPVQRAAALPSPAPSFCVRKGRELSAPAFVENPT